MNVPLGSQLSLHSLLPWANWGKDSALQANSQIGREVAIPAHLRDGEEFNIPLASLIDYGRQLFTAKFTVQEGAGRPMSKGHRRSHLRSQLTAALSQKFRSGVLARGQCLLRLPQRSVSRRGRRPRHRSLCAGAAVRPSDARSCRRNHLAWSGGRIREIRYHGERHQRPQDHRHERLRLSRDGRSPK